MNQRKKKNKFEAWGKDWRVLAPYKIDRIVDSSAGLEVHVSGTRGNSASGIFRFDTYYGYRNFDEGDLGKRWSEIGVLSSGVYVAEQSELLDWAAEQSFYQAMPKDVLNYLFVSIDDVFDVLAFEPPQFELLKS